jgi:hypothetical protein
MAKHNEKAHSPVKRIVPTGEQPWPSPAERMASGKALRDKVPRFKHSTWQAPPHRRDPLDILRAADTGRVPQLVPLRYGRMLRSPFTFYRGSAAIMAADLADTPATGIRVQACGDCHLMNFGGFATPERRLLFASTQRSSTERAGMPSSLVAPVA